MKGLYKGFLANVVRSVGGALVLVGGWDCCVLVPSFVKVLEFYCVQAQHVCFHTKLGAFFRVSEVPTWAAGLGSGLEICCSLDMILIILIECWFNSGAADLLCQLCQHILIRSSTTVPRCTLHCDAGNLRWPKLSTWMGWDLGAMWNLHDFTDRLQCNDEYVHIILYLHITL